MNSRWFGRQRHGAVTIAKDKGIHNAVKNMDELLKMDKEATP